LLPNASQLPQSGTVINLIRGWDWNPTWTAILDIELLPKMGWSLIKTIHIMLPPVFSAGDEAVSLSSYHRFLQTPIPAILAQCNKGFTAVVGHFWPFVAIRPHYQPVRSSRPGVIVLLSTCQFLRQWSRQMTCPSRPKPRQRPRTWSWRWWPRTQGDPNWIYAMHYAVYWPIVSKQVVTNYMIWPQNKLSHNLATGVADSFIVTLLKFFTALVCPLLFEYLSAPGQSQGLGAEAKTKAEDFLLKPRPRTLKCSC